MLQPYHQLLGNGIDAVLLGPTGAMCSEQAAGLDRCYWYKSDLYYPDDRTFAPGDDPRTFLQQPPGGTNCQLAPLARAWYEVLDGLGSALPLLGSELRFDTAAGTLHTSARYPDLALEVRTALAGDRPLLRFEITCNVEITVRACAAAGLWPEDHEQISPLAADQPVRRDGPALSYAIGAHGCSLALTADTTTTEAAQNDARAGTHVQLLLRGTRLAWSVTLTSSRYPDEVRRIEGAHDLGTQVEALRPPSSMAPTCAAPAEKSARASRTMHGQVPGMTVYGQGGSHAAVGGQGLAPALAIPPAIEIPDPDYQRLHDFSMYMFHGIQNRESGGIPVNNLRRTFNSHVFWDGAFVQRALLEAGHVTAARQAWRFLARTRAAAAANARATFDAPGLHWDWETTQTGQRAYIPWMQQRFQVHNTPLLAHMIMADYRTTRDVDVLAEGYDLLAGAATFILHAVLVEEGDRLVTRPLVGSHESARPVVDDGATVAACLRLLRDVALAGHLLGVRDGLPRRCATAARRLTPTMRRLFNGRFFQASRDEDRLNTSSLTPIYPADVVAPGDSRALLTAEAYRGRYAGRMAGHGNNEDGFPWSAGLLARILAYQGRYAEAWEQLDLARVALCAQGGCAEYVDPDGRWNMQYFSTAQAALCSALHALLLQEHGAEVRLFPGLPAIWDRAAFRGFRAAGLRIDARYEHGRVQLLMANPTARTRRILLRLGTTGRRVALAAGGELAVELEESHERS